MNMHNQEPEVNLDLALEHGLSREEYERILEILGRVPTFTELGIYSVMWSEHCSYKNSILLLRTLPKTGSRVLIGAGEENAGLVDIGDGLAVAFKIESHNHPSAIEPYQGAATGVGGIMRDIFTMGARPIAALNSLRFGRLNEPRTKYLFKQVVKGIGDYGNSFGVPTVAGEVYFDDCYRDNPIVNAMAVGIVEKGKVARAAARGEGNLVMIVGSATGRDGIHGATFASEEITEASEAKRPSVQVGDPFTEKLLLEATLEAIQQGLVVALQDMGAAGLTCSSTEMSARGRVGMSLNLDNVVLREKGMSSYEIMLSESQERMLFIVDPQHEKEIGKIFEKWDLEAQVIGKVENTQRVKVFHKGKLKADVPAETLVLGGGAPVYRREMKEPEYIKEVRSFDPHTVPVPRDCTEKLLELLSSPNIASKRWVRQQYDSMVRTNTTYFPFSDAAIVRIKGTKKALALKTDCNARYVYLNPRRGGQITVAEAARNVVCAGAKPIAITNCLNFGNPYDPEVYWQFAEAIAGISEACRTLDTPVTGGNVSFYNEGPNASIFPTPVIGMLGLIDDIEKAMPNFFQISGEIIILLGKTGNHVGGSEYLYLQTGKVLGDAPPIELDYEKRLQALMLELASSLLITSAHDLSEGGLAVALAEACIGGEEITGATIGSIEIQDSRPDFHLFGECQSAILVTTSLDNLSRVLAMAQEYKIDAKAIGETKKERRLKIGNLIDLSLDEARRAYEDAIPRAIGEWV
jgi:phosphoribosylformylglycinamidine synthase II